MRLLYPKSDGWYELNSTGVETKVSNVASGGGGGGIAPRAVTAATTAAASELVLANATTATFAVTLPAHASGTQVVVKKIDSSTNIVTITPPSGLIDGLASYPLNVQYAALTVISDGTNWHII